MYNSYINMIPQRFLLCLFIFIFIAFLVPAEIYPGSRKSVSNKSTVKKVKSGKLKCRKFYSYLRKKKRKKLKKLKNRIFICEAVVLEVYRGMAEFPEIMSPYDRWIKKTGKTYLLKLKIKLKRAGNWQVFLLTSDKDVTDILQKKSEIEFTAQLVVTPFLRQKKWFFIFLNEQITFQMK